MKVTFFYMVEKYYSVLLISIFGFYIAKVIEPETFGIISYVEAIVAILSIFSLQGVDQVIQRDIVNKTATIKTIISSSLFVKIAISVAIFIMVNIVSRFFFESNVTLAIVPMSLLIVLRSLLFVSSPMIAKNRYILFTILGVTAASTSFVIKMVLVSRVNSLEILSLLYTLDLIFLVSLYLYVYYREYGFDFYIDYSYCRQMLKEAFVLALSGGMIIIYTKVDQVFIANMLGSKDLADYAISMKFINLFVLGSAVFSIAFTSKLNKKLKEYRKNVKNLIFSSLFFGIFLGVLSSLLFPALIDFFYSDKYIASKDYVVYLSILIPLSFILSNVGRVLVNEGQTDVIFKRNIGALIINVTLNFVLIPKMGVDGAIISTIISYFYSSILYLFLNSKSRVLLLRFIK